MTKPREIFESLLAGIGDGDWTRLHLLYAEDVTVDMPFARPEPIRIHGRERIREHFAQADGSGISLTPRDVRVYETADPEVVIAEFDYETAGIRVANIQVLRVRDGLIVESRDYHNHAAMADVVR
jgi:ketosteroid isomerase-like protein